MIVFTGCGRSGTTYIATLMTQAGIEIGHESIGKQGIAAWQIVGVPDESLPMGLNIRKRKLKGDKIEFLPIQEILKQATVIFHQVRDPIKVIPSFYTITKPFWSRVVRHMPIDLQASTLEKAITYWYYNNLKAEEISDYRYKIEDIDTELNQISLRIKQPIDKRVLEVVSRKKNTRQSKDGYKDVTWKDVQQTIPQLYDDIVDLAVKYGYESEDM